MAVGNGTRTSSEFAALRKLSARVGSDPLLVQGAGGNTSLKDGDVLWIKASGTWLMNAERDDIFVPVHMEPLLAAVADLDPAAETAELFTVVDHNPGGLRPSIETTVHALMPQRVVLHVHCVETIALAVQANAEAELGKRLLGLNWVFVPYCRPGLPLAHGIAKRRKPDTDILVLGNHGLVVAADTVAEAEVLLARVCGLLSRPPRAAPAADTSALLRLAAGSDYRLPEAVEAHSVATDLASCRMAAPGSLYPDHVIFLGDGSIIVGPDETAATIVAKVAKAGQEAPMSILFPGKGVLMRRDANRGADALARCLADVTARIDEHARLNYLTLRQANELTHWDAEKYRQELTRRMGELLQ